METPVFVFNVDPTTEFCPVFYNYTDLFEYFDKKNCKMKIISVLSVFWIYIEHKSVGLHETIVSGYTFIYRYTSFMPNLHNTIH